VTDLGILIIITSFGIFFSPLLLGKKLTDEEKQKVHDIILQYGTFSSSYLSLMEDKEYYFPPFPDCIVAYKVRNSIAMVLGNPIGPKADIKKTIQAFLQEMHERGLTVAFCNVSQKDLHLYKALHLKEMKIGEEAFLQTDMFTTEGSVMAEIRQSINRMKRENVIYQWYSFSEIPWYVLTEVTKLHTEWQKNKKFASLTFSLDFYPLPVENNAYVLTVYSPTQTLWGAFTFFPYNNTSGMVLDTMLRSKDAPNGMVEAAFAESVQYLKGKGVREVSLGGAPLANSEEISQKSMLDQATKRVFENFNQIYGFRSLFTFKKKFSPEWKPMYLVYENTNTLPLTILALLQVHIHDSLKKVFIKKIFNQY
jgi:phosphatidylglycerol lysyltransferase